MSWTLTLLFAVLSLTAHLVFVRILGERLPSAFVTPAFYLAGLVMLIGLFFYQSPKIDWDLLQSPLLLLLLILAGVTIAMTDFLFVRSMNLQAPVSVATPVLLGGATVLSSVVCIFLFSESISFLKVIGILMTVSGMFIVHRFG